MHLHTQENHLKMPTITFHWRGAQPSYGHIFTCVHGYLKSPVSCAFVQKYSKFSISRKHFFLQTIEIDSMCDRDFDDVNGIRHMLDFSRVA